MIKAEELIKRRHPMHTRHLKDWEFLRLAFEGGDPWKREALEKYSIEELDDSFNLRCARVPNSNYVKHVSDEKRNMLFRQGVKRDWIGPEGSKELWEAFNRDIDNRGTNRLDFAQRIWAWRYLYSWCVVLVDKAGAVKTNKEAIERRALPNCVIFTPQNVLDWGVDNYGKMRWVLLRESHRLDEDPWAKDEQMVKESYLLWTRENWYRITALVKEADQQREGRTAGKQLSERTDIVIDKKGENTLGEVPIVIFRDGPHPSDPIIGDNNMLDIADLAKNILNTRSNLEEQILNTVYSFLVTSGGELKITKKKLGPRVGISLPQGGEAHWIGADIQAVTYLMQVIEYNERMIYQKAKIRSGYGEERRPERMSGVAHYWDSRTTNDDVADDAADLERGEMEIDRLFGLWENIPNIETEIKYPRNFSVTGTQEQLSIMDRALEQSWPIEAARELLSETVNAVMPRRAPEIKKKIDEAIAKWEPLQQKSGRLPVLPSGFGLNRELGRRGGEGAQSTNSAD